MFRFKYQEYQLMYDEIEKSDFKDDVHNREFKMFQGPWIIIIKYGNSNLEKNCINLEKIDIYY